MPEKGQAPHFKERYTLQKRKNLSQEYIQKNPRKLPIIVEKHVMSKKLKQVENSRYMIPEDTKLLNFNKMIAEKLRQQDVVDEKTSIYLFIGGENIAVMTNSFRELYEKYCDEDGFLYIYYSDIQKFG